MDGAVGSAIDETDDRLKDRLEVILSYGGLGMPVFPVRVDGKTLLPKGWQKQATDDALSIHRLFAHFPDAVVGLIMGEEIRPGEFVFASDVDPRNSGDVSLESLLLNIVPTSLPVTAKALTGEGGLHYLLTAPFPGRIRPLDPERYPDLDIKGVGGYIVVGPLIHPTTSREYSWLRHPPGEIAAVPKSLTRLLPDRKKDKRTANAKTLGNRSISSVDGPTRSEIVRKVPGLTNQDRQEVEDPDRSFDM